MRVRSLALAAGVVMCALACDAAYADVDVIVAFKSTVDGDLVEDHGGSNVRSIYGSCAVSARMPAARIATLRAKAAVAYVEEDAIYAAAGARPTRGKPPKDDPPDGGDDDLPATSSETMPWGVARVWWGALTSDGGTWSLPTAPTSWETPVPSSNVTVAVIDSGIDLDHPDLNVDTQNDANYVSTRKAPDDDNGHGTHVALSLIHI